MTRRTIHTVSVLSALILAAAVLASPALAAFEEEYDLQAEKLVLRNLIGEITVEGHDGDGFHVKVAARGRDASRENLTIAVQEGTEAAITIEFPLDREKRYVYPPMGPRSQSRFSVSNEKEGVASFLSRLFGGDSSSIRVSGTGSGMELWADVTIGVPRGASVTVDHGVGKIFAREVEGTVSLDGSASGIEASAIRGDLTIDTGSGRVSVSDVTGDVSVDTGSGRVDLLRIEGDQLEVDTGSGHIHLEGVRSSSVMLDTGSGGVSGESLSTAELDVDTGSGAIDFQFDEVGGGRYTFDAGSGSVEIRLPAGASATIEAETGSGGIDVRFEGARVHRHDRHEAEIVLGAGAARFDLDTGSGTIRILQAP